MADEILGLQPSGDARPFAIDALSASAEEEEGWRYLFRRLNASRTELVHALNVPLLLCIAPRLEEELAREGPDLWAIRASGMRLLDRGSGVELLGDPYLDTFGPDEIATDAEIERQQQRATEKQSGPAAEYGLAMVRLGRMLQSRGFFHEAATVASEAVATFRSVKVPASVSGTADLVTALLDLSNALAATGELRAAIDAAQEAVDQRSNQSIGTSNGVDAHLAGCLDTLATRLAEEGSPVSRTRALAAMEEAVRIRRALAGSDLEVFGGPLADSLINLSHRRAEIGRSAEALGAIREAVTICEYFARDGRAGSRERLAMARAALANRLSEEGRADDARVELESAITEMRGLGRSWIEAHRILVAGAMVNLVAILDALGRAKQAIPIAREAVALMEGERQHASYVPSREATRASLALGGVLAHSGRLTEALSVTEHLVDAWDPTRSPSSLEASLDHSESLRVLAIRRTACQLHESAAEAASRAVATLVPFVTEKVEVRAELAKCYNTLALAHRQGGDLDEALEAVLKAKEEAEIAAEIAPSTELLLPGIVRNWSGILEEIEIRRHEGLG